MYNDNRRNDPRNRRHRDWNDENRDGSNDRRRRSQQDYDQWDRGSNEGNYNREGSQSGYGSSMSSQGGGYGDSFYHDSDGYMHDSRYSDYGSDYRKYTDNYYNDRGRDNRGYESGYGGIRNSDSPRFNEQRGRRQQPYYGQSYESAYGRGGRGDHMGYGEKGAQYRSDFNGQYGGWTEKDRVRNRDHYREMGSGMGSQDMGSDSYFINTRDDAYRSGRDEWNIGNYGERHFNERGYGYTGRDSDTGRNFNDENYTW